MIEPFHWFEPADLEDACRYLARYPGTARPLAGGTDLVIQMQSGRAAPERVVDLSRLAGLADIREQDGKLCIGALTKVLAIERSAVAAVHAPLLVEAARLIASPGIRAMATVGGNLCNASPSADLAPPLLVLDAEVRIVGPRGEQKLPLAHFFAGPGRTVLGDGELLAGVELPQLPEATRTAFVKLPARTLNDISVVSVAVAAQFDPATRHLGKVRVALGAVAPMPVRAPRTEALLEGARLDDRLVTAAAAAAAEEARPIDDVRGTAAYRRAMVAALLRQALKRIAEEGSAHG